MVLLEYKEIIQSLTGVEPIMNVLQSQQPSNLMTIPEIADFLGLDYFHVRKLLLEDKTLGYYEYGRKKLWERADIIALKQKHYKSPEVE